MDLLKAEIDRKRKAVENVRSIATTSGADTCSFLRQKDIQLANELEIRRKQGLLPQQQNIESNDVQDASDSNHQEPSQNDEQLKIPEPSKVSKETLILQTSGSTSNHKNDTKSISDEENNAKRARNIPVVMFSQLEDYPKEKIVYKYLKSLLHSWEDQLNAVEPTEKNSQKYKVESKSYNNCKENLKPLLKMYKKHNIDSEVILGHIFTIVKFCEEGRFLEAHEEYLRTAIGNAAWPIGLTMVGIHERSGRERISTAKVAHIMNNEQQRKYLTSIKRLISFAQTLRPDIPPSMKV